MPFLRIMLVAAAAAFVQPAAAQDAERVGLARELVAAMKITENFDAVVPTVLNALKPALTGGNPKAARDYEEAMPVVVSEMSAIKGSLVDEVAKVYAGSFEPAELKAYVAFYRTPAGDKLARLTPVLAQQMLAAGQRFGQEVATRAGERMRDELRKRGNKI
jgi:uncharacterized protein